MSELKKKIDEMSDLLVSSGNEALVWAEETGDEEILAYAAYVSARAAQELKRVSHLLEQKIDFEFTVEGYDLSSDDLDNLAAYATELDESDDPVMRKRAAVIDQLIINFSQRGLKAEAESAEEKELARLREEYRTKAREKCYDEPREIHEKDIKSAETVKKIKSQIQEYRPMETSLSTRYCPDHPGNQVRRIGDYTYQCGLDKKIYNWQEGFTTDKGNKVPGSDVSRQTQHLGDRALEEMHFSTRENRLGANQ